MSGVVSGFTVIFIVVVIGYLLGRTRVLGEHAVSVLARLVFFVCTPALMITSLTTNELSVVFSSTLAVAATSAVAVGALYFAVVRLLWRRAVPEATIGALSSSYVNSVNLGLPIAIFVLDDASFIAPLLLFQIMLYSPIALVMLDLTALDAAHRGSLWRTVRTPLTNPIVIGGLIGLGLALAGVHLPEAVFSPLDMLGKASVPLALLAFGLSLTGVQVFAKGVTPRRDIALSAVLKMGAMPLVAYALARWGFGMTGQALFAQVVIAALPTAQNVLVYATRYGRGEVLARDSALITTVLSIPVIAVLALVLA
ncbi:putative AEC family transporter [Gordonia hirsuta DSM 44140 = NBRC 16056]|uniref:Putative AEC family transporter n=1 Tax=Gordonia hirsuta DSM 44140 = NBRC 16056 TaxID=1121927 RepID=L7LBP7_9ACTN|nr:AEC family transporter [Gordonia hirsuta]GAC57472.1 putative AEC family transporter [Gordonia hirsuta DSM 44140 = NBRC 16056]